MTAPVAPQGLRLMKHDDDGKVVSTPLAVRYVGQNQIGEDVWEAAVTAWQAEDAWFFIESLPAKCAVSIRILEEQ